VTIHYDIFNGDADGICALQQLRLEEPRSATLITGVKRDIRLLERVKAKPGDELTVLDIAMAANAPALQRALAAGARCRYFDHHAAGDIPQHDRLKAYIETAPDTCTSLIVDRYLSGRHRIWAVVAAFGDNLVESAIKAAQPLELDHTELARLHELGECMNYNAYGDSVDDLHYDPADLYRTLSRYRDPRHFMYDEPVYDVLRHARIEDLERAAELSPHWSAEGAAVYLLPDAAWSRRVNGIFGNRLAQSQPSQAHAVVVDTPAGYRVSVRAPLAKPWGAHDLCALFETGGGREGAAGINQLPRHELGRFVDAFRAQFAR
jgi:hypothetical protein